jgi:hypothetical protein
LSKNIRSDHETGSEKDETGRTKRISDSSYPEKIQLIQLSLKGSAQI